MADNPDKGRPWWRSTRFRIGVILALGLIILGYWLPIPWIGFDGYDAKDRSIKTLWDWLGLLIIPAALGVGGLLFSSAERKADREIAKERAENEQKIADERIRDSILREYLDRMSELLIEHKLATSEEDSPVRNVARARTLTLLNALEGDGPRKGSVVQFLSEAKLIGKEDPVVRLVGANLSEADLSEADLIRANLSEAILSEAILSEAILSEAILSEAILSEAILVRADLSEADLSGALLSKAILSEADLSKADLSKADLSEADLSGALLIGADLSGADLSGADLSKAHLREAYLSGVDLSGVDLSGVDLSGAYLSGATVTDEQLSQARSLHRAIMPDGSRHE
jgi:uncharacterized protein YjbI with pentapeptide repeats